MLGEEGVEADVVYLDLGISSMQVDARERGFSYSYDAPLDMRMDPSQELDARAVVNDWDERQLAQIFRRYGEERNARRIAREIVRRRERAPLETTGELVEAIEAALPAAVRRSFGGGHPAKRVFQAVRIAVNDELDSLDRALPLAWDLLRPGGRLAAISFHSLEDRRVKRFLADRARGCICPPDFPVCVCGHEPEAELLTSRAGRADAGRGRPEPARQVGPPARRPPHRAGGGGLMGRTRRRRCARPPPGDARASPGPPGVRPGRAAQARAAQARAAPDRGPARRTHARRAAERPRLDRPRRRPARRDRLLQRRPAADEPRDHPHGRPRGAAQARERAAAPGRGRPREQRAHPGGGGPARARAAPARRGALPEVEPDRRRAHRLQAHHRAGADASRRSPTVAPAPTVAPDADDPHAAQPRTPPTAPRRRPPPRRQPRRVSGCASSSAGSGCCSPSSWSCSAAAALRASWIGTVKAGSLGARAVQQQVEDIVVPARRGTILDRHGMELAVSEDAVTVFAHPFLIKDPARVVGATRAAARRPGRRPAQEAQRPQVELRLPAPQDGRVGGAQDRAARDRGHRHGRRAQAQLSAGVSRLAGARHRGRRQHRPLRARVLPAGHARRPRRAPARRQGRARRAGQPGRDRPRRSRATTSG